MEYIVPSLIGFLFIRKTKKYTTLKSVFKAKLSYYTPYHFTRFSSDINEIIENKKLEDVNKFILNENLTSQEAAKLRKEMIESRKQITQKNSVADNNVKSLSLLKATDASIVNQLDIYTDENEGGSSTAEIDYNVRNESSK